MDKLALILHPKWFLTKLLIHLKLLVDCRKIFDAVWINIYKFFNASQSYELALIIYSKLKFHLLAKYSYFSMDIRGKVCQADPCEWFSTKQICINRLYQENSLYILEFCKVKLNAYIPFVLPDSACKTLTESFMISQEKVIFKRKFGILSNFSSSSAKKLIFL